MATLVVALLELPLLLARLLLAPPGLYHQQPLPLLFGLFAPS